jgi:hypothetical protein
MKIDLPSFRRSSAPLSGAGGDVFGRTQAEQVEYENEFYRVTSDGMYDVAVDRVAEPYAPGEDAKRFRDTKPKKTPTTDTEKAIHEALVAAPMSMGYISNALFYASFLRSWSVREKKALWALIKGGVVKVVQSRPSNYWLVVNAYAGPKRYVP